MSEIHFGVVFEPWGDGAHIGPLHHAPDPRTASPATILVMTSATVNVWWLNGHIPDEVVREQIHGAICDYVRRVAADGTRG